MRGTHAHSGHGGGLVWRCSDASVGILKEESGHAILEPRSANIFV